MTKLQIIEELKKLNVEIPEKAKYGELAKLLKDSVPAETKITEKTEEPKEETSVVEKTEKVTLYDVNEHTIQVATEDVEGFISRGYRRSLK